MDSNKKPGIQTRVGTVLQRQRISSDTIILPAEKKLKAVGTRRCNRASTGTRLPLRDLDKNLLQNYTEQETNSRSAYYHVKTSVTKIVKKSGNYVEKKKVEEITTYNKVVDSQTYYSKTTKTIECRTSQAETSTGLQQSSLPSCGTLNKPKKSQYINTKSPEDSERYNLKRRNTTVHRQFTPYPKIFTSHENCDSDNDVLVNSSTPKPIVKVYNTDKTRHLSLNESGCISPIKSNKRAAATVIFQGIPSDIRVPNKKENFLNKKYPALRQGKCATYSLDIFNTEYLEEIIFYELKLDRRYVVNMNMITLYNPCSASNREAVINWLIQAQDYLQLPSVILFATVRLFDRVLENTTIACNMFQLVGLVITWILTKFEDAVNTLSTYRLLALCNGAYSRDDILKMERKLLAFFKFDLKIPDVTTYAAFYLQKLKIDSDLLFNCALYLLECYTLNQNFSITTPSIEAAAAVHLAINIIWPPCTVWKQLQNTLGYYNEAELDDIIHEMLQQLNKVQDPAYKYRQPFVKYSVKERVQVSIVLLSKLVAT